jgi:hypothetical protein
MQGGECRLRVLSCRNRIRIGNSQTATGERASQVEIGSNRDGESRQGWLDQHEVIAQQILARRVIDQLTAIEIVHPIVVGRNKNVRSPEASIWRASADEAANENVT